MAVAAEMLGTHLMELDSELSRLRPAATRPVSGAIARWRSDAAALMFHLHNRGGHPPLVAILGGTGTGKSTLVNRLLEATVSAASFRRTFTSGAVAIAGGAESVPENWLGVPHAPTGRESLPVRGEAGCLVIIALEHALTGELTLIDTPDLDGDQPAHHAEADRVFRWAEAVVFLVTPEKYQMTELLPYYRLARRYALPALFVMNKCEESAVLEDFRQQLANRDYTEAALFAIPRDDAAWEAPPGGDLASLRAAIRGMPERLRDPGREPERRGALRNRSADLSGRLRDQIIGPLREQRTKIEGLIASVRTLTAPAPGVDVSPVTQQLQRRLQEHSVLYLMSPLRILDRVRQLPVLVARLPRTTWDLFRGQGRTDEAAEGPGPTAAPDFPAILADQFTILQARVDDLLASQAWVLAADAPKIPASAAGKIAEEELGALKAWLEQRWQAEPRDTRMVQRLLNFLPGGKALSRYSEAAPYLLAVVLAAHGAVFGPVDLVILGSFSLATWLGEKLSNEVTSRTRQANRQIGERFSQLAREQIEQVCKWLDQQAPSRDELRRLERMAEGMEEAMER